MTNRSFLTVITSINVDVLGIVGRDDSLVDSTPFVRRVVGSNPALAAMCGPWASPFLTVACDAST